MEVFKDRRNFIYNMSYFTVHHNFNTKYQFNNKYKCNTGHLKGCQIVNL